MQFELHKKREERRKIGKIMTFALYLTEEEAIFALLDCDEDEVWVQRQRRNMKPVKSTHANVCTAALCAAWYIGIACAVASHPYGHVYV
jgi:hypothetical protein